ncbi:MAG: P1 family peptidase [Halanaerobiales bacterium]
MIITDSILAIEGISVGHADNLEARTGCTVILCQEGFLTSCEVRGGAPGTRENALLQPEAAMDRIHGLLLTGGSAFGLRAAAGVMEYLEERNIGFETGAARVPIVPAAVIYDLAVGTSGVRPDREMAYKACEDAEDNDEVRGKTGAACGATVGKILGMNNCMETGIGTAGYKKGELIVGALAVCNAFGDIRDLESGEIIAGAKKPDGGFVDSRKLLIEGKNPGDMNPAKNTTLGVVATNARLSKAMCKKVASMAHNGLARTIAPVHTMVDGDIIFCLASNRLEKVNVSRVGTIAAEVMARAIADCVKSINSGNNVGAK